MLCSYSGFIGDQSAYQRFAFKIAKVGFGAIILSSNIRILDASCCYSQLQVVPTSNRSSNCNLNLIADSSPSQLLLQFPQPIRCYCYLFVGVSNCKQLQQIFITKLDELAAAGLINFWYRLIFFFFFCILISLYIVSYFVLLHYLIHSFVY